MDIQPTTDKKRTWQDEVIYFMLTDRFHDGDSANNSPEKADTNLYDPSQKNTDSYHGGDFRGIEIALENGYFSDLGITAIWITPPVKNVWNTPYDSGEGQKTGYHGYWTQDFMDIDPHLTSSTKIDGTPYPPGRDGRMAHYKDMVNLAHSKGIKIIQDIVCNHAGPVFYYDNNGNRQFDHDTKDEWIAPYKDQGFHQNTHWAHIPEWNIQPTEPAGPVEIFGQTHAFSGVLNRLTTYGRKGSNDDSLAKNNGEEVLCDFFSLRDIWTHPDAEHYNELIEEFVRIYAFYIQEIGVDGLRIDTIRHVHHQFWADFTQQLRKKLGETAQDIILFGEAYDDDPQRLGKYTYSPDGTQVAIGGMLNFQLCWAMRDYLHHNGNHFGSAQGIEKAMKDLHGTPDGGREPHYNPKPGPDGLNARQKSITFIENHDGINRFRSDHVTARRNTLANAMVLTLEGIPCLYYGTENSLLDPLGKIGTDTETGRLTYIPADQGRILKEAQSSESYLATRALIHLRKQLIALRLGNTAPLWVDSQEFQHDDGTFIYARYIPNSPNETVLIAFNLSQQDRTLSPAMLSDSRQLLIPTGTHFERLVLPGIDPEGTQASFSTVDTDGHMKLHLRADSVSIWHVNNQK